MLINPKPKKSQKNQSKTLSCKVWFVLFLLFFLIALGTSWQWIGILRQWKYSEILLRFVFAGVIGWICIYGVKEVRKSKKE